jgi:acetyl esterase/lipase
MSITHRSSSEQGREGIKAVRAMLASREEGPDTPVALRRERMAAFASAAPSVSGVEVIEEVLGGVRALRLVPDQARGDVLFLHGGAYVLGSAQTHKGLAARYALASGATFHVLDYRLAPEHPYPAATEDALSAWAALETDSAALMGDSAGGGLALAVAIAIRDRRLRMPVALSLVAPWIDLTLAGDTMDSEAKHDLMLSRDGLAADVNRYRGDLAADDPCISPLFADLRGLPPIFLQVGGAEVLRSDAERLHAKVLRAGGRCELDIWSDMTHAFSAFGEAVPEAALSIEQMGDELRTALLPPKS